ncbi:hypothetical protein KNO15_13090 [Leifsonia shinshuensis]|uniref:hypothetical protein n=1 Tax=Leifsonia shinshuensis TaxID=150026 RepID=UPI001F50ACC5|nr:hypothetical protein [Leifsonia shinshuensis]MCI0157630.1 hypothetical protein [Leifsonia shinshuensis]
MADRATVAPRGQAEWCVLGAAIVVGATILVAPVVIVVAIGLIVWAATVLGRGRSRHRALLIAAIAILGVAVLASVAIGAVTFLAESTDDSSVTLIQG